MHLFSSFSRKTAPRCQHLSPTGRRCSQPACSSHPTLCFTHKPKSDPEQQREVQKPHRTPAADAAFLAEITQVCGELETPEQVRRALSLTFKAFVSRQISRETAGTATYILQMLLRSQREIAYHKKLEQAFADKTQSAQAQELPISWNVPDARRGPIEPDDIARAEKELQDLRELAAKEAEEEAKGETNVGAGLQPGHVVLTTANTVTAPDDSFPRPIAPLRSEPVYQTPYERAVRSGYLGRLSPTRSRPPL